MIPFLQEAFASYGLTPLQWFLAGSAAGLLVGLVIALVIYLYLEDQNRCLIAAARQHYHAKGYSAGYADAKFKQFTH